MQHKMAMKPYLERISGICDALTKEEIKTAVLEIAKEAPASERITVLRKIEAVLPGRQRPADVAASPVEETVNALEALGEDIEERIESIEDGSYWDDPDVMDYEGCCDETPDYVSDDQCAKLISFFDMAGDLFLDDRFEEARSLYQAIFSLMSEIRGLRYVSLGDEISIREERARHCRCVYETAGEKDRLDNFASAMALDHVAFSGLGWEPCDEDYPLLQDVIDVKTGEMKDMNAFLPDWRGLLREQGTSTRPASLLLEAEYMLGGVSAVAALAIEWGNR